MPCSTRSAPVTSSPCCRYLVGALSHHVACSGEQERFRRRDLLHALKNRREQIQQSLKRSQQGDRDMLLAGGTTGNGGP